MKSSRLQIPPLRFDASGAQSLFDTYGPNCGPCGPGAIAAIAGVTLEDAIDAVGPKWLHLKGTTEVMLTQALDRLGQRWTQTSPTHPVFGLTRIQWDGPWLRDTDPFEKYRHSHWVGIARSDHTHLVFDINAISAGGWISFVEWDAHLRPWLLGRTEPQATGGWLISDTYEVDPA